MHRTEVYYCFKYDKSEDIERAINALGGRNIAYFINEKNYIFTFPSASNTNDVEGAFRKVCLNVNVKTHGGPNYCYSAN
jgi:hypothetical protein